MIRGWSTLRLVHQFALAAALVLIPAMAVIGFWVTDRITSAVTTNTAQAAALYLESSVAPLVQELAASRELQSATIQQLDALMEHSTIKERVVSLKIWRLDSTIVYSRWKDMIGRQFPPSDSFSQAASGFVAAEFQSEPHLEDNHEQLVGTPLLEIYSPVRDQRTHQIIGVSEFYANGDSLAADLWQAKILSWLVVATVTTLMMLALAGIVYRGSKMIDQQRAQLTTQICSLRDLLERNEDLGRRLQHSNQMMSVSVERLLQKIGADLHDGPAQLLSYASLRLSKIASAAVQTGEGDGSHELQQLRMAISDALRDVRDISAGLSPPGLESATLGEAIELAIAHHRQHTGTTVRSDISAIMEPVSEALKVCVYRFVQEALTNAYRHAGGAGQVVSADYNGKLMITVSDAGQGFDPDMTSKQGLGLSGMRARVELLGGAFRVESHPGAGVKVSAEFDLAVRARQIGVQNLEVPANS